MEARNLTGKALLVVLLAALGSPASAQEFPGLGVGAMYEANMAFDILMDQQARTFCADWLAERTRFRVENNYWGPMQAPVTTQDLLNSNRSLQETYAGNNASWARNSAATSAAIGNYSNQAILGQGTYTDSLGNGYQLSNLYNGYYLSPSGYAYGSNDGYAPDPWQSYTYLSPMN